MTDFTGAAAGVRTRSGVYFGWRIVLALFLVTFAVFGVSIYSFIIFTQPLAGEFDWSAAQTGGLVSAMWLMAPLALVVGLVTTRVSPWRLIVFGMCVQAIVLASLVFVTDFWQLYALRMVMGVGKIAAVSGAPLLVSRWFSRRFGTAMALVWAGGSAGGLVLSPLTEQLVEAVQWRPACLIIAVGILLLMLAAGLIARGASSPGDLGLSADGDPEVVYENIAARDADAAQVAEAARYVPGSIPPFTAVTMMISIIGTGMAAIAVLSQEPVLLQGAGIDPSVAATLLGVTAGGSLIGSLSIGWMLDRLHGRWSSLAVTASVFIGIGAFALLPFSPGVPLALVGALGLGYGFGSGEVLWITLTKRQFGEALFPMTYGGWYFALQVGYAGGGSIAGWSFEHLGALGFLAFVGLVYLPPAISSLLLRGGGQPAPLARTGQPRAH